MGAITLTAVGLKERGFAHAFNLRSGGVSSAPFSSLNLGRAVGDAPAAVAENQRRFAAAAGFDGALYEVSQVHGAQVRTLSPGDDPTALRREQADALVAPPGGIAVGVRVADCLPLLLADPESGAVAAVHAGWRGVVAGVVEAAAGALCDRAAAPGARLVAAIFPHIRRCCFEVGADVAAQLQGACPDADVVDRTRERPHVDLHRIVLAKLVALGVVAERIEDVAGCTRCEPERFFSYRREGQRSGRHIAAIESRAAVVP